MTEPETTEMELPGRPAVEIGSRFGLFRRTGQRFALPIQCLLEVLPGQELTRVPQTRPEVAGLLNLRGEILTVLLVDEWLDLPATAYDAAKPILVLRQEGFLFGIQVDNVEAIITIPESQIQPQPVDQPNAPRVGCLGVWQESDDTQLLTVLTSHAFLDLLEPLKISANP
jgi:chemotaxis signal transduction protein